MLTKKERVDERLRQMPKLYRAIYKKAMAGRSRKAAMHSFCLECCGWQIKEVYLCTDTGCSLYPYRPESSVPPDTPESVSNEPESTNSEQEDIG